MKTCTNIIFCCHGKMLDTRNKIGYKICRFSSLKLHISAKKIMLDRVKTGKVNANLQSLFQG
jgi:hypothetical protein